MNIIRSLLILVAATLPFSLAGCGGGGGGGNAAPTAKTADSSSAQAAGTGDAFMNQVMALAATSSDSDEPVALDSMEVTALDNTEPIPII